MAALDEADASPGQIGVVLHATTLVANALIERRGASTALVTTRGFEDLLNIAREKKYDIYDIFLEKPPPLAPRERCFGVGERIAADGSVIEPVDADSMDGQRRGSGRRLPSAFLCESGTRAECCGSSAGSAAWNRGYDFIGIAARDA
jgi:hypothetical protein